ENRSTRSTNGITQCKPEFNGCGRIPSPPTAVTTTPNSSGSMNTNPAPTDVSKMAKTNKTTTAVVNPLMGWLRLARTKMATITPNKPTHAKEAIPCSKLEIFMVPPCNFGDYNRLAGGIEAC